jgi:hypothetical protein
MSKELEYFSNVLDIWIVQELENFEDLVTNLDIVFALAYFTCKPQKSVHVLESLNALFMSIQLSSYSIFHPLQDIHKRSLGNVCSQIEPCHKSKYTSSFGITYAFHKDWPKLSWHVIFYV